MVYQVLWLRELSLVFGVTVYAASTVLAAFMGGLAAGGALTKRLLARVHRPLAAFGAAEIGVGLSAVATPIGLLTVAHLVCSMLVLLGPTLLMGVTLPLLSSSSLVRESRLGSRMSGLYAVNTAGATVGAVTAGFYLIGSVGMRRTFLIAAAINVLVGACALWLDRGLVETAASEPVACRSPSLAFGPSRAIAFAMLVSGAASLGLEIVWFRILAQFLVATTYAFTTMLATVLLGIAAGGTIASRLLVRDRDWRPALACALMATGIAAELSLMLLASTYQAGAPTSGTIRACAAAIFPAAVCMGIGFPLALREGAAPDQAAPTAPDVASRIGRLYALNLAGAILGVLAAGFVILPRLGSRRALIVLAGLFVVAGLVVIATHPRRWKLAAAGAAGVLLFVSASRRVPDPLSAAMSRRYPGLQEFFRSMRIENAAIDFSQLRGDVASVLREPR